MTKLHSFKFHEVRIILRRSEMETGLCQKITGVKSVHTNFHSFQLRMQVASQSHGLTPTSLLIVCCILTSSSRNTDVHSLISGHPGCIQRSNYKLLHFSTANQGRSWDPVSCMYLYRAHLNSNKC